jgi:hypothetical protein
VHGEFVSIHFHGRALDAFGSGLACAFFAENGQPQVPNFIVDVAKGDFGESVWWSQFRFKTRNIIQGGIDLIRRELAENSTHRFNFRNAMANHHYVVSGVDSKTNGIV